VLDVIDAVNRTVQRSRDAGILVKLLVLGIGSFLITLGLVELLIRSFKPMRRLFGMKPKRKKEEETKTAVA